MSTAVWFVDGHLSWVAFGIIVLTLAGVLVTDWVWRVVHMRVFVLLPLALALWCVGVAGIWLVG